MVCDSVLNGLGKALPKGSFIPVPFFCDVFMGEALHWGGNRGAFMGELQAAMEHLASEGSFRAWE